MIMGCAVPKAIQIFMWDVFFGLQDINSVQLVQPVCSTVMRSTLGLLYE